MSAFKRLTSNDIHVKYIPTSKKWSISFPSGSTYVDRFYGLSSSLNIFPSESFYTYKTRYRSIKHLYYSGILSGSLLSSSFEYYPQSSLDTVDRNIENLIEIFSISSNTFGVSLKPGSLKIKNITAQDEYILNEPNYVEETILTGQYINDF